MYLQKKLRVSNQSQDQSARVKIMTFKNALFFMRLYGNRRRKALEAETELPSLVYAVNRGV